MSRLIRVTDPTPAEPASTGARTAAELPPLLARAPEAARLCGLSRAAWDRLASAGQTPAPIRLGGAVLWDVAELRAWVAARCPDRAEWDARQTAANGRTQEAGR